MKKQRRYVTKVNSENYICDIFLLSLNNFFLLQSEQTEFAKMHRKYSDWNKLHILL